MYPNASAHYTVADAYLHRALDTVVNGGPLAAQILAAQERQQEAQSWAAVWVATHTARKRMPGAWRRWLGTFLVGAGTRLQNLPPLATNAAPTG